MTLRVGNGEGLDSTRDFLPIWRCTQCVPCPTAANAGPQASGCHRPSQRKGQNIDLEDYCSHLHKGASFCPVGTARDVVAGIRNVKLRVWPEKKFAEKLIFRA